MVHSWSTDIRKVLLEPLEVRLRLREGRGLIVEALKVNLEVGPRLRNVAR